MHLYLCLKWLQRLRSCVTHTLTRRYVQGEFMFNFFKKKKTDLDVVFHNLTVMGYDILPYGIAVAM